jgi:hypothetical protein
MKRYLLSIYQPDGDPPPPEVLKEVMQDVDALVQEIRDAGVWVFNGGLHPPRRPPWFGLKMARCSPPTARSPRARSTWADA